MKKILINLLLVLMLLSLISINVFAEDEIIYVESQEDIVFDEEDNARTKKIVLNNDVTLNKELTISKNVDLYLNGHTLTVQELLVDEEGYIIEGTEYGIHVKPHVTLSIYGGNKNEDKDGVISGQYEQTDEGKVLKSGALVYVENKGTLNLYSGTLKYGCSTEGGGIKNEGTTNMYGGTIASCLSQAQGGGHGGGIWNGNVLNIFDGYITNCSAHVGGGIYNWLDAKTYIEKIKIDYCSASEAGGGIYTAGESTLIVNTETPKTNNDFYDAQFLIMNCSAGYIGGGMATNPGDKIELKNDIMIILNNAPQDGGVANGANGDNYPGYFKIAGKVVIKGNDDGEGRQSNFGITGDSYITLDGDLLPGTDLGIHMSQLSEKDIVMISKKKIKFGEGVEVKPDFDGYAVEGDEGDKLIVNDKVVKIDLAKFKVQFETYSEVKIDDQYVQRDRNVKDPKIIPTKDEYVFTNWSWTNEKYDYDIDWDFDYNKVTTNMVLEAKYKQIVNDDDKNIKYEIGSNKDISINFNDQDNLIKIIITNIKTKETWNWDVNNNEDKPYEIINNEDGSKELIIKNSFLKTLKEGIYEVELQFVNPYNSSYKATSQFTIYKNKPKPDYKAPSTGIE